MAKPVIWTVDDDPDVLRAVLGYLSATCGVCHQGGSTIPGVHLDLRQPWRILGEPPGLRSTLGQPTRTAVPGPDTRAIAPGAPDASLVLHRMGDGEVGNTGLHHGAAVGDVDLLRLHVVRVCRCFVGRGYQQPGAGLGRTDRKG